MKSLIYPGALSFLTKLVHRRTICNDTYVTLLASDQLIMKAVNDMNYDSVCDAVDQS